MNKNKLYWFFQIVGWSLYNINEVFQYSLQYGYDNSMVFNALANIVLSVFVTHLFRIAVKRFNWVTLNLPQLALRVGIGVFFMTIILVALNLPLDAKYVGELLNEKPILVIEYFINLAKPFLVWALIYMFYNYSEEKRLREIEEIK